MRLLYQDREKYLFSNKRKRTLDYPLHLHSAVELVFLTGGSGRVVNDGESYLLEAGDLFVSFPNQVHGYTESRDTEGYLLIVPVKPWLQCYHNLLTEYTPACACLKKGQWEHSGLLALLEQASRDKNDSQDLVMQGYFQVILGKLLKLLDLKAHGGRRDVGIGSVLWYIHAHYQEPLSRKTLAQALGYNESYISHIFAENVKMSMGQYIQSLRVEDALHLLESTELSVARIAAHTGFGSIRSFNRAFQRIMHMSPREYREKNK